MKQEKIVWPDDLNEEDEWPLTTDGTHCWTREYAHPKFSQDTQKYSHKFNKGENLCVCFFIVVVTHPLSNL
jgi:hypothetical protein